MRREGGACPRRRVQRRPGTSGCASHSATTTPMLPWSFCSCSPVGWRWAPSCWSSACPQSPEIPWKRETSSKPVSAQCSPDWSMKVAHPLYNFIWEQDKAGSRCCLCCSSSHRRGSPVVNAQIWVSFSALPHVLRMTFVKLFNCSVLGRFGCKMGECLFSTTPYLACLIPNKFCSSISL